MRQFRAEREGKKKWICTNDDAASQPLVETRRKIQRIL